MLYYTATSHFDTARGAGIMMLGNEKGGTMSIASGSKGYSYFSGNKFYLRLNKCRQTEFPMLT
jgi:hypothetical protein